MKRIAKLLAVVAIAFVWAYLAGIDKHLTLSRSRSKSMVEELIASLNTD